MYITSLQYIILMCLCYPLLRMPNKQDMTSQTMEQTTKIDNKILDENKSHLNGVKRLKQDCKIAESSETTTQSVATNEYISIDVCFIFLYHMASRKSAESILATTALFFWKVSSFPVNCTVASTDRTKETKVRKSRSVSTSHEFKKGDCADDWFEYEDKCYQAVDKIMNYKSADAHCKSLESELANIQTMNENAFITNLANEQGLFSYLWIAAQKVCLNCTQTVDGYANWLRGQPSGVSKCVTMNSRGEWRDFDCGYMFAFVCEKVLNKAYTKRQLLFAVLVPIFSCLAVAISFTTGLLVSSVRRGGQPFKVASRYQRTKKERKQTTWDMVDMLRRASSLTRRGSRLKPQRHSAPSIEITKAEDTNGSIVPNDTKKKPWYKRGNAGKTLAVPEERRGSSNSTASSGNSSLYELLARLNKIEFEPPNETRLPEEESIELKEFEPPNETRVPEEESIELKDLSEHKNELKPGLTDDEDALTGSHKQLVEKKQRLDDHSDVSFRNMAFRDSVVSVEANGSGIAKVTPVQQMNQRDSMGKTEDITSDMECSLESCSRDSPRDISRDSSHVCSRDSISRDSPRDDNNREETEASKNTQTVRVDVHNISNNASISTRNGDVGKHSNEKPQPSKGKVIWTYSL